MRIVVPSRDVPKQVSRYCHLGHLESGVAAMAAYIRADLHQLFPQRGRRPVLHLLRQGQRPHEVGQIVGQAVTPNRVVAGTSGIAAGSI